MGCALPPKKDFMTKAQKSIVSVYRKLAKDNKYHPSRSELIEAGVSRDRIRQHFGNYEKLKEIMSGETDLQGLPQENPGKPPKVLLFDIETAPIMASVWGIWDQNVALNQINRDWFILSWSAKWLHEKDVMYTDSRKSKKIEDDRPLLAGIWKLLDEADVVVTQNGKAFDSKKLNARFVMNGFQPPSSYKHIDTLELAKKHFGFTSNKLAYLTDKLCKKHKKSEHKKFPGFELWKECIAGNLQAWKEMETYNKLDVLSLEELYKVLSPWDGGVNFSVFHGTNICKCGSFEFDKNGYYYTNSGKFQRYRCKLCGAETRDTKNLAKKGLKVGTSR